MGEQVIALLKSPAVEHACCLSNSSFLTVHKACTVLYAPASFSKKKRRHPAVSNKKAVRRLLIP